jgi:SAM-dependent methyltransferase
MTGSTRTRFRGLYNIIRFNWPMYIFSMLFFCILITINQYTEGILHILIHIGMILNMIAVLISIIVSTYIYDFSDLYQFKYLLSINPSGTMLNIHAGFDETSSPLKDTFPLSKLHALDFYNPKKHTERSIRKARKAYPAFPGTISVKTSELPFPDQYAETILLIFAAHEIRNRQERILFFRELSRTLKPDGRIVVTEHLRDWINFLAYTFGFFHFLSRSSWLSAFKASDLKMIDEIKTTPFITTFILEKNGNTY